MNVRLKKDGAHHSVGGIIIRWCPILFDALRADVAELEKWESGLNKVVDDFNVFAARASSSIASEANSFQWFCYFMDIQTALEEGQNTLIVSPKKEMESPAIRREELPDTSAWDESTTSGSDSPGYWR